MPSKHDMFFDTLSKKGIANSLELNFWKYAGGDHKEHLNYWKVAYKDTRRPPYEGVCPCSTKITRNCYITNGETFIVVGNCCIKKFMPERSGRSCEECNAPHKNRKDNFCNSCREKKERSARKTTQYVSEKTDTICACGKACGKYPRCYNCNLKLKSN